MMTDREKFLERWLGRLRGSAQQAIVRYADAASDAAAEAWAKAEAARVEKFGEPRDPARDALVLKADAAMRKWQERAKEVDLPRWTIDLMGLLCSWRATVLDADVEVYADTWPEAVLQCDALAEPIWQARESK